MGHDVKGTKIDVVLGAMNGDLRFHCKHATSDRKICEACALIVLESLSEIGLVEKTDGDEEHPSQDVSVG